MQKFIEQKRYKDNLFFDMHNVYSYKTRVAIIDHKHKAIFVKEYFSRTTTKHINYVSTLLNYTVTRLLNQLK